MSRMPSRNLRHRTGRRWAAVLAAAALTLATPLLGVATVGAQAAPQTARPSVSYGWASVDAGSSHSCGTRLNHGLWCWGLNSSGQLGDGTSATHYKPDQVGTGLFWASVSAGGSHTCAKRLDNSLWCWGYNAYGQLGNRTTATRYTPGRVGDNNLWVSVSVGDYHSCGYRENHSVWCWGYNAHGQVGDGTSQNRYLPTIVQTV
jgi:alpha-tubulin suppressor-like RCC1 family protein